MPTVYSVLWGRVALHVFPSQYGLSGYTSVQLLHAPSTNTGRAGFATEQLTQVSSTRTGLLWSCE